MQLYQLIILLFLIWLRLVSGRKQLASDETEYDMSTEKSWEKDIAENIQELAKILQNQKERRLKKNKGRNGGPCPPCPGEHCH